MEQNIKQPDCNSAYRKMLDDIEASCGRTKDAALNGRGKTLQGQSLTLAEISESIGKLAASQKFAATREDLRSILDEHRASCPGSAHNLKPSAPESNSIELSRAGIKASGKTGTRILVVVLSVLAVVAVILAPLIVSAYISK